MPGVAAGQGGEPFRRSVAGSAFLVGPEEDAPFYEGVVLGDFEERFRIAAIIDSTKANARESEGNGRRSASEVGSVRGVGEVGGMFNGIGGPTLEGLVAIH